MIARETSNRFKKLLITDKFQQKLGVLRTTVHTGRSPPNYSQDSWLQSSWNRQQTGVPQAARYISMVIGDQHSFLSSRLAAFWHSLRRTYNLSSLYCTQTLMSSDFIEQLLHRNKQLQTSDINNCRTSTFQWLIVINRTSTEKSSHSIIHASSS